MEAAPEVAVIILNWNAAADTLACARQVAAWTRVRPTLWIVDNASQDESLAQLRAACAAGELPRTTVIANPTNQGFAGGTNRGIEAALAAGDAPVLLLNNDARVTEDDMAHLLAVLAAEPSIGVVGPVLYHGEPPHAVLGAGQRDPVLHHHTLLTALPPGGGVTDVDYISGSVALVRAALLRQVGLLDEDFFFNTEVAELCRRARTAGWRCVVDGGARATHHLERSSALRSTLYTYYLIRNRFVYIRKVYCRGVGGVAVGLLLQAVWALYGLALAGKLGLQGDRGPATAVWLGTVDGVRGRWGGQNARVLAACAPRTP